MSQTVAIDYGPLSQLIGTWKGDKGIDIAPEPDGSETNPYYENITFSAIGDVTNAESQVLTALHYRQIVRRKSDDEAFHDETGYWMWDAQAGVVMQSLAIPRGVSLLAGAVYQGEKDQSGNTVLEVSAAHDDKKWQIIQSPFMHDNAQTRQFSHKISVGNNQLTYFETTLVAIYGKEFKHTDQNELVRQG